MNILIIGKGAREHALAWHFSQSPLVTEIWVAPGNAGTEQTAKTQNLQVTENNISRLVNFAQHNTIDFCFVCTENALTAGLADAMQAANITCFGPLAAAALCRIVPRHLPSMKLLTFDHSGVHATLLGHFRHRTTPSSKKGSCGSAAWRGKSSRLLAGAGTTAAGAASAGAVLAAAGASAGLRLGFP